MWGPGRAWLLCALGAGVTAAGTTAATASVAPSPSPTFAKTVVLQRVSGTVLIEVPGARYGFVRLSTAPTAVPVGTLVDTTGGRVRLTSANPQPGSVQSGQFFGGRFQIKQSRAGAGLVNLVLRDNTSRQSGCSTAPAHPAAVSKRILGLLRGNAKGHFRTVGRFSAATVLGTNWGVRDRCDGTLTVVRTGVVVVTDFRLHRNVTVRAGQTYLAKAP
jgi:hypothetical protein